MHTNHVADFLHHEDHYQNNRVYGKTNERRGVESYVVVLLLVKEHLASELKNPWNNNAEAEDVEKHKKVATVFVSLLANYVLPGVTDPNKEYIEVVDHAQRKRDVHCNALTRC